MSKYHYDIEPKVNNYQPSQDYGKVFGWEIIDHNKNCVVRTYLLHETGVALTWPLSKKVRVWALNLARQNGFDGKVYV